MKKPLTALSLMLVPVLLVGAMTAACGDDATDVSTPDSGTQDAAPAVDSSTAPMLLTGTVDESHVDDAGAPVPIPGATVCLFTSPELPCVQSADDGAWGLYSPPPPSDGGTLDFGLVATAPGHLGNAALGYFGNGGSGYRSALDLRSDAEATAWAGQAGFTYPANGTGFLELRLDEGASAVLSPASGKGPVYGDATLTPSPALTAATSSRVVWFGNVTPGPFTITVTAPGKTCKQVPGVPGQPEQQNVAGDWPGPTLNSLSGAAVADAMLVGIEMSCE